MELYKRTIIISVIVSLFSFLLALLFDYWSIGFWTSFCLGVSTSGLIVVVVSWIQYLLEFRNHLLKIIYKLLEISELLDDLKNISGNDKIKRTNEGYEICKRIGDVGYDLFRLDEQIVYFGNAYKFKRYLKQSISTIQDSLGSLSEQEIVISNINTLFPDKDEKFIQKTILIKKREICIRLYVFNTEFLKRNIFSLLENIKVPMKLSDLSAFSDRISDETLRENFSTDIEEMENNVAQFDNLFSVNAEVGKKHKAKRSINPR